MSEYYLRLSHWK